MEIIPLGPGFAAELRGANLIDVASSDSAYRTVREAFDEHTVLVFRNQRVTDEVQTGYSRAFGPLERTKAGLLSAGSLYIRMTNIAEDGTLVAGDHREALINRANQLWHTDSSFKATPALASVLSARIIPSHGGETEFTSTRRAWERLSSEEQERLHGLIVVHSYANSRGQIDPQLMTPEERAALPPVRWRMTWRNPVNGCDALYLASHAASVEGMDPDEGKALLTRLMNSAAREGHTYMHRWQAGDVVMWDNRASMHRGRPWPEAEARLMVRTTVSARDADGLDRLRPT
jgi:alpha-ketoglutarate-dependent 2,4-dichlorophenoxyacetate dioxygenase